MRNDEVCNNMLGKLERNIDVILKQCRTHDVGILAGELSKEIQSFAAVVVVVEHYLRSFDSACLVSAWRASWQTPRWTLACVGNSFRNSFIAAIPARAAEIDILILLLLDLSRHAQNFNVSEG